MGTCADYIRHTEPVKAAGAGSEAQTLFSWIISQYRRPNPERGGHGGAGQMVAEVLKERIKERIGGTRSGGRCEGRWLPTRAQRPGGA